MVLLIGVELVARFYIGLGHPALAMTDPEIEYLPTPSQSVQWLHSTIKYNACSQRSDDFPQRKTDPNEFRVLVVGDSVINGWPKTDQSKLATTILEQSLSKKLSRPVIVANAACASWGPPNQLAYLKRFGLFDADVVILVLSSHDYADVPTFAPDAIKRAGLTARRPICASEELLREYVVPAIMRRVSSSPPATPRRSSDDPRDVATCLAALREMIHMGRSGGARVIVALHLQQDEIGKTLMPGHDIIRDTVRDAGAEVIELGPVMAHARAVGQEVFLDDIHPNDIGQEIIASRLDAAMMAPQK